MPEDSVAKSFPTLEGAQVSKEVWARTYVPWIWEIKLPMVKIGEGSDKCFSFRVGEILKGI